MPQLSRFSLHLLPRSSQSRCLGYQHLDPLSLVPSTWIMRSRAYSLVMTRTTQELNGRNHRFCANAWNMKMLKEVRSKGKAQRMRAKSFLERRRRTQARTLPICHDSKASLARCVPDSLSKELLSLSEIPNLLKIKKLWRKNVENQMLKINQHVKKLSWLSNEPKHRAWSWQGSRKWHHNIL